MPQALLVNADAGTQLAGTVVRAGAVSGSCVLASSDTSANYANIMGTRISDVLAGATGTIAAFEPGLRIRMAEEPHPNDVVYLTADGSGLGTTTTPTTPVILGICYASLNVAGVFYAYLVIETQQSSNNLYLTNKGDILTRDDVSLVRLPVGTDGQVLTARSTAPVGVGWETPVTNTTSKGSIFSAYGPLSAPSAAGVYDFTLYDSTRTLAQNLAAANMSGVFELNLQAVGTPNYAFVRTLTGGLTIRRPANASPQGGCLVANQGSNSAITNVGALTNVLRITGALTIEALVNFSALTTTNGDWYRLLFMTATGETENTNSLYMIAINVTTGPVFTLQYFAEHDAGVNIQASTPFVTPLGVGPIYLALTRTAQGHVKFYVDGQAVSGLIVPTDSGGGGVVVPTRGPNPTQELNLNMSEQGAATLQWHAAKITAATFTDAQIAESFRRSMFGVGTVLE